MGCNSIPPPFFSSNRLPKSCPTEGRDSRWSGRKRHRIRHLEFCSPRLLTEELLVRVYPGEPFFLVGFSCFSSSHRLKPIQKVDSLTRTHVATHLPIQSRSLAPEGRSRRDLWSKRLCLFQKSQNLRSIRHKPIRVPWPTRANHPRHDRASAAGLRLQRGHRIPDRLVQQYVVDIRSPLRRRQPASLF